MIWEWTWGEEWSRKSNVWLKPKLNREGIPEDPTGYSWIIRLLLRDPLNVVECDDSELEFYSGWSCSGLAFGVTPWPWGEFDLELMQLQLL